MLTIPARVFDEIDTTKPIPFKEHKEGFHFWVRDTLEKVRREGGDLDLEIFIEEFEKYIAGIALTLDAESVISETLNVLNVAHDELTGEIGENDMDYVYERNPMKRFSKKLRNATQAE